MENSNDKGSLNYDVEEINQASIQYLKFSEPEKLLLKLIRDYFPKKHVKPYVSLEVDIKSIFIALNANIEDTLITVNKLFNRSLQLKTDKHWWGSKWINGIGHAVNPFMIVNIEFYISREVMKIFDMVLENISLPGNVICGRLRGQYAAKMYKFLKSREEEGDVIIGISELRNELGMSPTIYKMYGNFKSQVLKEAQHEMNIAADISFTFEEIKSEGKISKIWFKINKLAF